MTNKSFVFNKAILGRIVIYIKDRNNITLHIGNIFKEGELDVNSVRKESLLTALDGKKYRTKFYNLDVIISVGYRVKSKVGERTQDSIAGERKKIDPIRG